MSQQITLEEFDNMLTKCVEFYNESSPLINKIRMYRKLVNVDVELKESISNTLKKEYDEIIEYEKLKKLLDKCKDFYGTKNEDLNEILGITHISLLVMRAEDIKSIYTKIIEYEKLKELLDKCKDFYPKSNEELNEILKITSIPLVEAVPSLLQEADRIKSLYRDMKKRKIIAPSEKYRQRAVYDFGSNRSSGTKFEINYYSHGATSDNSILLYIFMHGDIPVFSNKDNPTPTPILMETPGVIINKYSISAPAQCSINSSTAGIYMIYALSHAVNNNDPLDVGAMLRESLIYNSQDPQESFRNSLPVKKRTAIRLSSGNSELLSIRQSTTGELAYDVDNPIGEEVTDNPTNKYIEKSFELDVEAKNRGVYLCNDWESIGGDRMDNLLGNKKFLSFMGRPRDSVIGNLKEQKTLNNDPIEVMNFIKMSDIIEFCKLNGKTHINIVDGSCSVFSYDKPIGHRTTRLVANKISKLQGYAKGIVKSKRVSQRKKNKHTKRRKQTKGKGKNRKTR